MKFNPTWQQVVLLLGMLAAVIGTHLWAPLAVSAVTSIVSTIVGALFVNLDRKPDPNVEPTLTLYRGGLQVSAEDGKKMAKSISAKLPANDNEEDA